MWKLIMRSLRFNHCKSQGSKSTRSKSRRERDIFNAISRVWYTETILCVVLSSALRTIDVFFIYFLLSSAFDILFFLFFCVVSYLHWTPMKTTTTTFCDDGPLLAEDYCCFWSSSYGEEKERRNVEYSIMRKFTDDERKTHCVEWRWWHCLLI